MTISKKPKTKTMEKCNLSKTHCRTSVFPAKSNWGIGLVAIFLLAGIMRANAKDAGSGVPLTGKPVRLNERDFSRPDLPRFKDSVVAIRGRVFNTKEPPVALAGVTVQVKGTAKTVVTDNSGNFDVKAHKGDVLLFTIVGYKSLEYNILSTGENNIVISLQNEVSSLDALVVTGYTEKKLKHLASAISTVDVKSQIEGKPIMQLSQALQGGTTGLTVTQGSGLPGGDAMTIKIRGISTLGNTTPLVLIDGVPGNINDVEPITVESMTVLKDAAAASIYGSRAANGVILVTTKRGKAGEVNIVYDAYAGIQKPTSLPNFVDAPTYMEMVNTANQNIGGSPTYTQSDIDSTRAGTNPLLYPNTNWKKLVIKDQIFVQNHSLGVSGGNSQARFAVNGTYLKQDGLIPQTTYDRYSLRANTSVTLKPNLSMYLDLSMIRNDTRRPIERFGSFQNGDGAGYILFETYRIPPNIVAKYPLRSDGYQGYGNFAEMLNPIAELEQGGYYRSREDNISINFQPQWEITHGLKLRGQYLFRTLSQGDITARDAYNFLDYYTNSLVYQFTSTHSTGILKRNYEYSSLTLDYNKTVNKHTVYLLGGLNRETDNTDGANQFAEATLASYFVKLNYIFNDKYLLETTARADGSSRFGPGHKWGVFPSMAAGWNVHKEKFMEGLKAVNNLKLRASYGLLGNNQNVGLYQYQNTVNTNGTEAILGNPDLTWETVNMTDLGADIGLYQNKLSMTFDWYNKVTDNILLSAPLSYSSGIGSQKVNAGKVRNKGWEWSMNYSPELASGLITNFNVGYSYYKNTILKLKNGPYLSSTTIQKEGYALGSYYGYRTNGLLQDKDIANGVPMIGSGTTSGPTQQAGDIKYVDINGDGTINSDDQTIIGNPNAQSNYFANMRMEYKGLDFEVLVNGFGKSDAFYTGRYISPLNLSGGGGTPMTWQTDTWSPSNMNAALPRLTPYPDDNARFSDYWRTNAAFARVRYIQLGYTIRGNLLKKAGIKSSRVYFNAQNPLTFTKMKYLDPETRGTDNTFPIMKIYTIGLNIKL